MAGAFLPQWWSDNAEGEKKEGSLVSRGSTIPRNVLPTQWESSSQGHLFEIPPSHRITFFGTLTMVGHWLRAALWEYGPRSKRIVAGLVHQLCSHSMKPGQFFLVAMMLTLVHRIFTKIRWGQDCYHSCLKVGRLRPREIKWPCYHHSASDGLEPDWSSKLWLTLTPGIYCVNE